MVIALIVGGLTLFGLLATLCSERRKRNKAWAPLSLMFLLYAIPQAFSMGVIAYLYNTSSMFYMGTRYNASFILCIISWISSIMLSIILTLVAMLGPPEYGYEQLH